MKKVDPYWEASENKKPLLVYFKYKNKPDTDRWNIGVILLSDVDWLGTWGKNGRSIYSGKCDFTDNRIIVEGKPESVKLQGIDEDSKVGEEFQISMVKNGK
jgi:hypothetical protein